MQLGFAAVEASAANYVETLARLSLFADVPHPQLEALAHSFEEEVFAEGQRVIRQDVTGGGFYVILDGDASIVVVNHRGTVGDTPPAALRQGLSRGRRERRRRTSEPRCGRC